MGRKNVDLRLNPLFRGPTLEQRETALGTMQMVPLGDIEADPEQPRKEFDDEALKELAASISSYGVICPIMLRPKSESNNDSKARFFIVAGERRYRAAQIAGLELIPAVIDSGTSQTSTRAKQLVENLQRESLNPMERALAINQFRETESWSIREIASKLGVSKALVQRSFEILSLPEDLQLALAAGASESKILVLKKVEDPKARAQFLKLVDDYTRSQLEEAIAQLNQEGSQEVYPGGTKNNQGRSKPAASSADRSLVESLQRSLGVKVSISRKSSKRGRLSLEFYSDEDLKSLSEKLLG